MTDPFDIAEVLQQQQQEHLLEGIDVLSEEQRQVYLTRLGKVNWQELQKPAAAIAIESVNPSRVVSLEERAQRHDALAATGEAALQAGQAAVLMVAGGQGTRLGFSGPKGCYEVGVHSGKSIYQLQAEKVLSLSNRCGVDVPFLIMTSPMTDVESRDYFAVHNYFGLKAEQVRFFSQGTVPSIDEAGKVLRAGPGQLLENPDGHGGCHTALVDTGELAYLKEKGIAYIIYIQVDNILAPVDDSELLGLAIEEKADVITKVLEKAHPDEKVGHLVKVNDRDAIVEYTEVTPEQCRELDSDGNLIYRWGSPAMHCWSVEFFAGLADNGFVLPLHRSSKPLQAWQNGSLSAVTGWKNERFIFDLVPQATVSLGLQIDRSSEFAPVKNAEGADSAASTRVIASEMYVTWLEAAGVKVELPDGDLVEISPVFAATQEQFLTAWDNRCASIAGNFYLE
ncbi:MAG: UTP--glucose-1-phosphate uridylyltransferase [Planctomycetes bacterium]|nr:UTP--glucose-1-phosphate uridylyltransferase [Planctomycetota bacterium]